MFSDQEYNSCICCHLHHQVNRKDLARIKRPKESSWTKDPHFIRASYCCTVTFVCFFFFFKTMQLYIPVYPSESYHAMRTYSQYRCSFMPSCLSCRLFLNTVSMKYTRSLHRGNLSEITLFIKLTQCCNQVKI